MSRKSIIVIQFTRESIFLTEYISGRESVSGQMALTPELWGDHEQSGKKIASFLDEKQISSSNAIVIPPTADVLVRSITVPPLSDMSMLKGIVLSRLQKELKISADEINIDYTGTISSQSSNNIILAGILKKRALAFESVLEYAGLSIVAVVPDFISVFHYHIDSKTTGSFVYVDNGTARIILVKNGSIYHYASLSVPENEPEIASGRILGEIQRDTQLHNDDNDEFTVIGSSDALTALLNLQGAPYKLKFTDHIVPFSSTSAGIAGLYMAGREFELNFSQNHFTEKKQSRLGASLRKIVLAIVALLILLTWFFLSWEQDKRAIVNAQQWLTGMDKTVKESNEMIARMNQAKLWSKTDAVYSQCLRDISAAFPESSAIWTQSLAINDKFVAVMTGTSSDKKLIQKMMEAMIADSHFSDIKTLYIRQSGKSTDEISFALQFSYKSGIDTQK
ncbi:MAG: hypothetical protein JW745_04425 [Sedimentisphaerales bacterium]|nr:hypothetical protein [Sedimentisphaerales bacterium]MBN2843523.1 hypothetical protein [Sedimentisphaerales bacterium]